MDKNFYTYHKKFDTMHCSIIIVQDVLKKFSQSLNPGELKEVQVSEKFRVLVALGDDSTLRLWNVKNDANFTLVDVIQYVNKDIVT